MTIKALKLGSAANDGTGDTLREGGRFINENFAELDQRAAAAQSQAEAAAAGLASKVDKVQGLGLSETSFTEAEKAKLAGVESSHFRGTYANEAAMTAGATSPRAGDYADVDRAGSDAVRYIWDVTDSKWIAGGSASSITAAQVKSLYESNPDTNALTNALKTKIDGVASGATANAADAQLRDRSTHTGFQLASTISDFASAVRGLTLTGLSLTVTGAIVAADSVLAALGKLQAQINGHFGKGGTDAHPVATANAEGFMPKFPSINDSKTYAFKNGSFAEVALGGGDIAYIYPNGGTEAAPAVLAINAQYINANPFAGSPVLCEAQVFYNGKWVNPQWHSDNTTYAGVKAAQTNDDIATSTGISGLLIGRGYSGTSSDYAAATRVTGLTGRVRVWRVKN